MKGPLLFLIAISVCGFFPFSHNGDPGTVSFTAGVTPDTARCDYTAEDTVIFNRIMPELVKNRQLPGADLMVLAGRRLLGTPYVGGTLEREPERLIINLRQTDCILFVETCLGLAQTAKSETPDFETFCRNIRRLRYRDGKTDGYTSRIHYTSEWVRQAEKRGLLREISREAGGRNAGQKFYFMSAHPEHYKQLSGNNKNIQKIKEIENRLNGYEYYFIPKEELPGRADRIREGDIIGFNTSVPGLDMSHVGIAVRQEGQLRFIHASMTREQVITEPASLTCYVGNIRSNNGIRVIRPVF